MDPVHLLTVFKEGEVIKTCPIQGEIVVGRAEDCALRLDDRAISRQHALFKVSGNQVQVEKKSEFGILMVNGAECSRVSLKEGDIITLGPYMVRVSSSSSASNPSSKPPAPQPSVQDQGSPSDGALPLFEGNVGDLEKVPVDGLPSDGSPGFAEENLPQEGADPFAAPEGIPQSNEAQNSDFQVDLNHDSASGNEAPQQEPIALEPIDEDGKTKVSPSAKITVQLVFAPGTANHTIYELTKDEVSIGRGKTCDIILNDKKASRKSAIIRRAGINFVIKDLESANGTFVNGVKVQEQELSGDDVIKIGGIEFQFKAISAEYSEQEKDFISLPAEPESPESEDQAFLGDPNSGFDTSGSALPANPDLNGIPSTSAPALGQVGVSTDLNQVPGITGINSSAGKKKSLLERYRALPKKQQNIILVGVIVVGFWIVYDDGAPVETKKKGGKKPTPTASASPTQNGPITFDALPADKKAFVEHQHAIAFEHFKNQEFDKALFEVRKIFDYVQDYENSREIERYALEGKRKREAIEDEKQKKKEAEQLRAKIVQLEEEIRQRMEKKNYEEAKEFFSLLLAIDPDNAKVVEWKKEIDTYEENLRIQAQAAQAQMDIDKHGWNLFQEAIGLKKAGKYHSAISGFQKILDIGIADKKLMQLAKTMQNQCRASIKSLRDPVLREAKTAEDSGDFATAFKLYQKATRLDPPHPAGYAGMNRVKGVLHSRAKALYTEAILAESYNDFATARKLYQECLQIAPTDDIYHDRAQRRLAHYFQKEEAPAHE
jgi:pSer/pThr/pTyr-binding forkhead associated (FHA) protein/tetratricopeptide (TPR) repeat protein